MALKIISARFASKCGTCQNPIAVDQPIEFDTVVRTVRCMACVDPQRHAHTRRDGTQSQAAVPAKKLIRTYEQLFGSDGD